MADSIYREESIKRVSSPEELNDYIKVARPSVWIIISAALVLLVSVFVWAIFGSLDTTVSAQGVYKNGKVICFLADASGIKAGADATCSGIEAQVLSVSSKPLSLDAAGALADTDEYTLYCLGLSDWNYVVELSCESELTDSLAAVSITTGSVSPVAFLWD